MYQFFITPFSLTGGCRGRDASPTSNVTAITEVRNASFGMVLHAQHILQILLIFSSPKGYQLQFSTPRGTCIFCVCGMALYRPTLQFYVCVYVSFVCRYVATPGECYYNTLLCCDYFSSLTVVRALSLRYACIRSSDIILIP